jgi:hypothetical protein
MTDLDNLEEIPFEGQTYWLSRQTTGADYLALRKARDAAPGDGMTEYGELNLLLRLKRWTWPSEITKDSVLALPSAHFHVLQMISWDLDNKEAKPGNDFILGRLNSLKLVESPSELNGSKEPLAVISDSSSGADESDN